ncbi:MAG: twin-arginine translocation signal domain-containing protein, partial [Candidatus Devosia euplotis]|nr:twin-arginine translocation signal domain-containing protein [Candidatus Devosia euplotis]
MLTPPLRASPCIPGRARTDEQGVERRRFRPHQAPIIVTMRIPGGAMCRLCDSNRPDLPCPTRRDLLAATAIGGVALAASVLMTNSAAAQQTALSTLPESIGTP